jgi:beta-lactamase regulating signal transducer with metallopeptidase domain
MPPVMIHVSANFLMALASAAARSLAFGCMVAAAIGTLHVKNARIKLLLWKGVLLAALAMPLLTLFAPVIQVAVPVPSFQERRAKAENTIIQPALPHEASPRMPAKRAPRAGKHIQIETADSPTVPSQPVAPRSVAPREIPWSLLVVCAYLAIGLAFLARVFVGMRFGKHLVRAAIPVTDSDALRILSTTSSAAGLRATPRIAEADIISVPVVIGVSDPAILLPSNWREWDEGEFEAVLAHEVSHVERHDALAQRLALIHRAIFWFSPLSWWLERHLAELSEQASDDAALAGGADRTRYAETLLGFFAELEAGPERVWWQGVSMAKAGQAEKRVDRILAWRGTMSNKLTKSLVVALAIVAVPVVALTAAIHPAAYNVQAPPAPADPPSPGAPAASVAAPSPASDPAQAPAVAPAAASAPAPPALTEDGSAGIHFVVPAMPAMPPMHVEVPAINLDVPPMHVAVPRLHIETLALPAMPQQDVVIPPMTFSMAGDWNSYGVGRGGYWVGRYYDWGPRFAIIRKDSDDFMVSGDREDAEHARELKKKIPGDFIWFARDEKSYIISDATTVERAKQLWQPNEDLGKQQKELAKQQEELAKQAEDAREKFEDMKIKVPDLSAEMQKVQEAMKQLSANGGTMNEIGDLQRQIGELQRQIGEAEAGAGRQQGVWGREQGEWGRKMGEIGRQQGEIGRKLAEQAREASRQMQQLLDDAIAHGLAKPE